MSDGRKIRVLHVVAMQVRWLTFEWLCQELDRERFDLSFLLVTAGEPALAPFLDAHGVAWARLDSRAPGRIIYEDADQVVVAWPDEFLSNAPVDKRTALVILTHDVKFDIPLLRVALRTDAGFIGAMGSRRTHANRVEELRRLGISDSDLARISAPVGLDIGARTPEETAISIAAEIIALRENRRGARLSEGTLPVHNDRTAVTP